MTQLVDVGQATEAADTIAFAWQRWACASLLGGVPIDTVTATLVAEARVQPETARSLCETLIASPAYAAGDWVSQRYRKLESTLTALQTMRGLLPADAVDRRSGVGREDFLRSYYATNTPVVLCDVAQQWPALSRWTPAYFAEVLGASEIEVMHARDSDPDFERRAAHHRRRMTMADFVSIVSAADSSNDAYLTANNKLLELSDAGRLWDDFNLDTRYLTPDATGNAVHLWLGPRGTITPLHHDTLNILFVQVSGRKRITLISPLESHCLANNVGVFSDVDPDHVDAARHPRFASARPIEVVVEAGEAVFIPVGWWHRVESLSVSTSLSFTNFVFPNRFHWANPEIHY